MDRDDRRRRRGTATASRGSTAPIRPAAACSPEATTRRPTGSRPSPRSDPLAYGAKALATVPPIFPSGLVNPLTMRAFNEAWFRKAPKSATGRAAVDRARSSTRSTSHRSGTAATVLAGFLQYQFAVPDAAGQVVGTTLDAACGRRRAVVPRRAQEVRRGEPGPAVVPAAGLDPRDRRARGRRRARSRARRPRRAGARGGRAPLPGQGLPHVTRDDGGLVSASGRVAARARPHGPARGCFASDLSQGDCRCEDES